LKKVYGEEKGIKVISPSDCGNAPKKKVLKDLLIALAVKDIPFINEYTKEDIRWDIVNDITVQGREQAIEVLEKSMSSSVMELNIHNIITHGKTASANGTFKFENNKVYAFCNVFNFVSAGKNIIKEITSYIIQLD
jgi:hypothetical protein